jgi:hypothetical protein
MPFSSALSFDITDTYSHVLQVHNIPSFERDIVLLFMPPHLVYLKWKQKRAEITQERLDEMMQVSSNLTKVLDSIPDLDMQ